MIEERRYPVECTCGFCAPSAGQEDYFALGIGQCTAWVGRYLCTREPGHPGEHVACELVYHPVQDVD